MKPHLHSLLACAALSGAASLHAELRLPAIVGDHMVLQQKQANTIWGWDTPGTTVTVSIGSPGQTASPEHQQSGVASAGTGRWSVVLDPLDASDKPATITIKGSTERVLQDVLVGEVWICSGQSNMQWDLRQADGGDLEVMTAKLPGLRLISVPQVGTQELKVDFQGAWAACTPETAAPFSAVGYHFGRLLHEALGVPVGLIDNAWGGSSAEAWIRRDVLEQDARFSKLMAEWKAREESYPKDLDAYETKLAEWNSKAAEAEAAKLPPPPRPQSPQGGMTGNHRPGNIFAGVLNPTVGYGIKGAIWYQGESNAGRAHEYRTLFPLMIAHWREVWQQGDFPFYWVQLADFMVEKPEPGESAWAELREAQTLTQTAIPNGGQAVIIDIGEANDIHPRNKREVGARLARLALARDYGMTAIPARSPEYKAMTITDGRAALTFDHATGGLRAHDDHAVKGFAVCGEDRKWVWATAAITGPNRDQIEVSSPAVRVPVAVRYGWADNPDCNVVSAAGLPLTPFRTDDFPMLTAPQP